jgi:hypothetical protein
MKGQLVFEFLVAGMIFFGIVVYTINYMNVNVSDFRLKSYQNRLQSKAVQISEVMMGSGPMSVADGNVFNITKIDAFNETYCKNITGYQQLVRDLHLYEKSSFGIMPGNVKIELSSQGSVLLECGLVTPRNVTRAEMGRLGLLQGEMATLRLIVW